MTLRNDEYVIEIRHRGGRSYSRYRKVDGRWLQEVVSGKLHTVTAEQLLNHLLPVLAGIKSEVEVVVRQVTDLARSESRTPSLGGRAPRSARGAKIERPRRLDS
jgi:hypothetical protein